MRKVDDPIPANCSAERLADDFDLPMNLVMAIDVWGDEFQTPWDIRSTIE
ncbi:hypothetical protein Q5530_33555 [Saccharothrix sp. BKS2]